MAAITSIIVTWWRQMATKNGPTLAQVMASCLTAPCHYLSQCSLTINEILWQPFQADVYLHTRDINNQAVHGVIMRAMASQITGISIVCSTFCSGADQRKQRSVSLAFVRGIYRWLVNFPYKGPVTQKIVPFDEIDTFEITAISPIHGSNDQVPWCLWPRT